MNSYIVMVIILAAGQLAEEMKFSRLAGTSGILGSLLSLVMVLSATFLSSWFSWRANALSDLGVGEQAALFNSAMLLGGGLNFLFALGLYKYLPIDRLVRTGSLSLIGSSVCLALIGVFPIDNLIMHAIVALGYFMLTPAGFLLIGFGTKDRVISKLSFACGIAALLAILVLPLIFFVLPFQVGFAVPELTESVVILIWTIYMSTKLLRL